MNIWLHYLLGMLGLCGLAWLYSEQRRSIPIGIVVKAWALQIALTWLCVKFAPVHDLLSAFNSILVAIETATRAGTTLVFGFLGGGDAPYIATAPANGFVLAFQALPMVLVMSALSALLFHWRVLPALVRAFSTVVQKMIGVGSTVSIAASVNVFVGMVEAPLLIKPWLAHLDRAQLLMIMTTGLATIAGTVMALYASFIAAVVPDAFGHLMAASVISVPGAVLFSAILIPPGGDPGGTDRILLKSPHRNTMDAITQGTLDGLQLLLNIIAMLVVLVALVTLVNLLLGQIEWHGQALSLQRLLSPLMRPLAWMAGVSWEQSEVAGDLLSTRLVINELVAYLDLAALAPESLSASNRLIMSYALCGFANFASLGILIGGLGAMIPERRDEVLALTGRALFGATLATLSCGAAVGLLSA